MSSMIPWMAFVLGCAALAAAAGGEPSKADPIKPDPAMAPTERPKPHATVALVSEADTFIPGTTTMLGLTFSIEKDWHLYWNGRNDTGIAPSAEFTLPEGFTIGAWQWPAPIRHVLPGDILDHIYEQRVTLLIPVHVAPDAKPRDAAKIRATVDWLVCNEACVPESAEVALTLPIGATAATATRRPEVKHIAEARARLPIPFPTDGKSASISWSKDKAQVHIANAAGLAFFPATDCLDLAHPIADTTAAGDTLTIRIRPSEQTALRGVLEVRGASGKPTVYYTIDARPVQTASPAPATPPKQETHAPTTDRR